MRVTLLAIGSRGDVQPYVALGAGLQRAGHEVRVATHGNFETLVRSHGLEIFPVEGNPKEILETEEGRAWLDSGPDPLAFFRGFVRLAKPRAAQMLSDSWRACRGAEAVVYSTLGFAGYHIAEKLGVPSCAAALQPLSRTRSFPPVGLEPKDLGPGLTAMYNLMGHLVAEQLTWQPFRRMVNQWRRQALGLPPMPFTGPFGLVDKKRYPVLYGFSPSVVPRPPDWGPSLHVTGYWFAESPDAWRPPGGLEEFLAAGPPPVYVGFGSMTDRDPRALTGLVLEAVRRAGQRCILLTGWAGLTNEDMPGWAYGLEEAPHEWLFPRTAAVVHHGGSGTTGAGLRAGVPNVVVPFFGDQAFWGRRVRALGVGPTPIPRREITAARLSWAIGKAVSDVPMRAAARALGERIRGEDGVARAVEAFDGHLRTANDGRRGGR